MVFGLWHDRTGRGQLKPWMQNVVIVPVFCYYALQFSRSNPVQPVISVLTIMLAVRLAGVKSVRHSLQIYALSMFCLAASSLFDLSPFFLIYLIFLLFAVAIATVLLTFQDQDDSMRVSTSDLKKIISSGLLMPALAVPLLVLIFPIMPRTPLPLWNFLSPPTAQTSGYSDTVAPGSRNSVAESQTLAFRAELPLQWGAQLYWRGTVFNHTDGIRWTRTVPIPAEQPDTRGLSVKQTIFPEPSTSHILIALDRPASITLSRVKRSPDGVFEYIGGAGTRIQYGANSFTNGVSAQRTAINRKFYLQLPQQVPPRVASLADEIVLSGNDNSSRVAALENYFRNGDYRYSTSDLATGDRALEQFLFEKKRGHCEFFASSFALVLRAAGVPCRLVGGYLGGEYNQLGGYYVVTDARAHVWVEAFIEKSGWIRIDPSSFAANAGDIWTTPKELDLKHRLSLVIDSLQHTWNRTVIPYDFVQQMQVINSIGTRVQGFQQLRFTPGMVSTIICMILLVGLLYVVRRVSPFRTRERRILERFLRTIENKFGIAVIGGRVGLFEIAATADDCHATDFVLIYAGAVYHDRRLTDAEYVRLKQILHDLQRIKSNIS
jgi:transglutaminase-like putative cysteine protease